MVVNGPVARELGINSGGDVFGPGGGPTPPSVERSGW